MRKFIHGVFVGAFLTLLFGMLLAGFGVISYAAEGFVADGAGNWKRADGVAFSSAGALGEVAEGYVADGAGGWGKWWGGAGSGWDFVAGPGAPSGMTSGQIAYASSKFINIGSYATIDGKNWPQATPPPQAVSGYSLLRITPGGGQLYAIYKPQSTTAPYRIQSSPDGGVTWVDRGALPLPSAFKNWYFNGWENQVTWDSSYIAIGADYYTTSNESRNLAPIPATSTSGTLPTPGGAYGSLYVTHQHGLTQPSGFPDSQIPRVGGYYYLPGTPRGYSSTTGMRAATYRSSSLTSLATEYLYDPSPAGLVTGSKYFTLQACAGSTALGSVGDYNAAPAPSRLFSTTNMTSFTQRTRPSLPGTINIYPYSDGSRFYWVSYVPGDPNTSATAGIHIAVSANLSSYAVHHIRTVNGLDAWPSINTNTVSGSNRAVHFFKGKMHINFYTHLFSGPIPQ